MINRAVPVCSGRTYLATGHSSDIQLLEVDVAQAIVRSFPSTSLLDTFLQKLYLVTDWTVKIDDARYLVVDSEFEKRMTVIGTHPFGRVEYHTSHEGMVTCLPPSQDTVGFVWNQVDLTSDVPPVNTIGIDTNENSDVIEVYRPYDKRIGMWNKHHRYLKESRLQRLAQVDMVIDVDRPQETLGQQDGIEENPGPGEIRTWTPLWEQQVKKIRLGLIDGIEVNPGPEIDLNPEIVLKDYDVQAFVMMWTMFYQVRERQYQQAVVSYAPSLSHWVPRRSD